MAAGRHVDRITLHVTDYDYTPIPDNFREAWVALEFVGERIDRERMEVLTSTSARPGVTERI